MQSNNLREIAPWRTKRIPRVTIIAGLIGKQDNPETNGIVIACDSQTTWGNMQRSDTEKISEIIFRDGKKALIAQSGDSTLGSRTLELLTTGALQTPFDDWRKPADLAQQAMSNALREQAALTGFTFGTFDCVEFLKTLQLGLMVAYYYGNPSEPYLYIVDAPWCMAARQYDYAAMGCGANVAELILSRSDVPSLHVGEAVFTAIYIVEEVKRVDAYCGGPTKVAMIFENGVCGLMNRIRGIDRVNLAVELIAERDAELKSVWRDFMAKIGAEHLRRCENQKLDTPSG
jgi:20S proteasome alpha/beta subunit